MLIYSNGELLENKELAITDFLSDQDLRYTAEQWGKKTSSLPYCSVCCWQTWSKFFWADAQIMCLSFLYLFSCAWLLEIKSTAQSRTSGKECAGWGEMKGLRPVLRRYPFEKVARVAGDPQGQGKCLCGYIVRSVREKERSFGGGSNHCLALGWTKGAAPGTRTWLCYSSESEMRQKWFTKGEDFTTGIQGAMGTHSFEKPTACWMAAVCAQRTTRTSARFWEQQLHLPIIFHQNWQCLWRKATENKQVIQFVTLKTHFLSASSFTCFPSSFLSVLLSRGCCSEHWVGFWHQRRNWLQQNEAWCTQKEEKEQQVEELVTYSALPFVTCDSRPHQRLMWLLWRTVSLHSCFGWSDSSKGSEMLSTHVLNYG